MNPSGGNSSWWTTDTPRYLDINHQPALYSSQSSQWVEGDVRNQQMVQQPGCSPYPMSIQEQMLFNHTAQDQDEFQSAQVKQVLEVPFQIQQGAQQNPPSISSLSNGEFSIDLETPGRSADPPSYHNLEASHSWQSSQWVEDDVQHHQLMVQHPGYSPWFMPNEFNCIEQLDNGDFEGTEAVYLSENWSIPSINENKSDKNPSPAGGYISEPSCHATYQEPPEPFPVRYETIESLPEASIVKYDERGVEQENSGGQQIIQVLVMLPQPSDTNGGQKLEDNRSYLDESIPLQQVVTNEQPHFIDLPNPPNSQVQVQIQYKKSNKTPEGKTPVHRAFRSQAVMKRALRSSAVKSSTYKCPECEMCFIGQYGLTQHQRWAHSDRNFQCKRCNKKYPAQNDLDRHIAMHDMPDKPFKCSVCPKEFCHKSDLRRHMLRHADSTPYKCDICSKCFFRNDHLLMHQQQHERRKKPKKESKCSNRKKKSYVISN